MMFYNFNYDNTSLIKGGAAVMDYSEYQRKYKRFIQGLITEEDFRKFLELSLSKRELVEIIISNAEALRKAVAIGEPLEKQNTKDSRQSN